MVYFYVLIHAPYFCFHYIPLAPGAYNPEKAEKVLHSTPAFSLTGKSSHDVVDYTPGKLSFIFHGLYESFLCTKNIFSHSKSSSSLSETKSFCCMLYLFFLVFLLLLLLFNFFFV